MKEVDRGKDFFQAGGFGLHALIRKNNRFLMPAQSLRTPTNFTKPLSLSSTFPIFTFTFPVDIVESPIILRPIIV